MAAELLRLEANEQLSFQETFTASLILAKHPLGSSSRRATKSSLGLQAVEGGMSPRRGFPLPLKDLRMQVARYGKPPGARLLRRIAEQLKGRR